MGRKGTAGMLLVVTLVVFGEALGELIARWILEIGVVLIVAGILVAWWYSYMDDEPEIHEYETCAWGAIGQDDPSVCIPERKYRRGGRLVIERCRKCEESWKEQA